MLISFIFSQVEVEIPVYIEKIVEKPVDKIIEVEKPVDRIIEKPVDRIVEIEKPVFKEIIKELEKIVHIFLFHFLIFPLFTQISAFYR